MVGRRSSPTPSSPTCRCSRSRSRTSRLDAANNPLSRSQWADAREHRPVEHGAAIDRACVRSCSRASGCASIPLPARTRRARAATTRRHGARRCSAPSTAPTPLRHQASATPSCGRRNSPGGDIDQEKVLEVPLSGLTSTGLRSIGLRIDRPAQRSSWRTPRLRSIGLRSIGLRSIPSTPTASTSTRSSGATPNSPANGSVQHGNDEHPTLGDVVCRLPARSMFAAQRSPTRRTASCRTTPTSAPARPARRDMTSTERQPARGSDAVRHPVRVRSTRGHPVGDGRPRERLAAEHRQPGPADVRLRHDGQRRQRPGHRRCVGHPSRRFRPRERHRQGGAPPRRPASTRTASVRRHDPTYRITNVASGSYTLRVPVRAGSDHRRSSRRNRHRHCDRPERHGHQWQQDPVGDQGGAGRHRCTEAECADPATTATSSSATSAAAAKSTPTPSRHPQEAPAHPLVILLSNIPDGVDYDLTVYGPRPTSLRGTPTKELSSLGDVRFGLDPDNDVLADRPRRRHRHRHQRHLATTITGARRGRAATPCATSPAAARTTTRKSRSQPSWRTEVRRGRLRLLRRPQPEAVRPAHPPRSTHRAARVRS